MGSALLSASEMPSRCVCTSQNYRTLFTFRLSWLCTTKTPFEQWTDKLFTIEDICKTSYWSDDENSKLQSPERSFGKREQSPRVKKRTESARWEESGRESVFSGRHMDNVQRETHAVSVMTQRPLARSAVIRDEKDDPSFPAPKSKAKADEGGEKFSKNRPRGKLYRQKEHNSVPLQKLWKPVM